MYASDYKNLIGECSNRVEYTYRTFKFRFEQASCVSSKMLKVQQLVKVWIFLHIKP